MATCDFCIKTVKIQSRPSSAAMGVGYSYVSRCSPMPRSVRDSRLNCQMRSRRPQSIRSRCATFAISSASRSGALFDATARIIAGSTTRVRPSRRGRSQVTHTSSARLLPCSGRQSSPQSDIELMTSAPSRLKRLAINTASKRAIASSRCDDALFLVRASNPAGWHIRKPQANQTGRGRPATPNGHSSAARSQRPRSAAAT